MSTHDARAAAPESPAARTILDDPRFVTALRPDRDLRLALAAIRDGTGEVVDWRYLDVNAALLEAFGWTREHVVGATTSAVLGVRAGSMHERWLEVLRTGRPLRYESEFHGRAFLIVVFRLDTDTIGTVGYDTTEHRTSRHEFHAQDVLARAVFEHSTDVMLVMEPVVTESGIADWRYADVNGAALRLFGVDRARVIGHTLTELFPERVAQLAPRYEHVLLTGEPAKGEVTYRDRHFELSMFRIDPGAVGVFARDTTERRVVEQRLASDHAALARLQELSARLVSEDSLEALLDAVIDAAVAVTGADSAAVRLVDDAADALRLAAHRGLPADYVTRYAVVPGAGVPAAGRTLRDLSGHVVEDVERDAARLGDALVTLCRDGGFRAFLSVRMVGPDGRLLGVIGVQWHQPHAVGESVLRLLDLLGREAAHLIAHRRREAALRDADRRKTEFLAMLSHELRNPLATIRTCLHLLDRELPGSDGAQAAKAVLGRQAANLGRLVDDLLDVTRIEHGKIELQRGRIDGREVLRRTCDDLRAAFDARGIALHLEDGEPVWLDADETRVGQIVGNLLQNAAKFGRDGGRVDVSVGTDGGRAVIRVRDDGVGIEPALVPRVFDAFVQAEGGLARSRGGLGLGLALVRGLAELHGGTVAAHSEGPGRGAEFTVTLPLATAPAPVRPSAPNGLATVPRAIVLIEDHEDTARLFATVLELEGHRVTFALDGTAGIALAQRTRPEFVICDLGLPDVDGYEVARRLRADVSLAATRLVALSGYAQPEDRARALAAGYDAHLAKPPALDELRRLLAAG